ncbi:MAG: hypothetical protein AB1Z63_13600 [Candidatus Limnocylindrales bacterium]
MTNIVSGAVSTVTELGKDEAWLQSWLREQPNRLGLGDLEVADSAAEDDRSFLATDDDRCFSVDVQLGEMEASRGFQVLDNWARNRVLHPDKTHVAVLVTEVMSDRYQTTLETLAEHLPLVVVELAVWKGQDEAIVVPHVALSSDAVDLAETPAAKAAEAVAKVEDTTEGEAEGEATDATAESEDTADDEAEVLSEAEAVAAEAEAQAEADADAGVDDEGEAQDKDDTGVGNPWGLEGSGSGSTGLLSKVGQ